MEFYIITKPNEDRYLVEKPFRDCYWSTELFDCLHFNDKPSAERWLKNMIESWHNKLNLTYDNTEIKKLTLTIEATNGNN